MGKICFFLFYFDLLYLLILGLISEWIIDKQFSSATSAPKAGALPK